MIRNWSYIKQIYKKNINFIWYDSILTSHTWQEQVKTSFYGSTQSHWYNKNNVYENYWTRTNRGTIFDNKTQLEHAPSVIKPRTDLNLTHFKITNHMIWRRYKFSILRNYIWQYREFNEHLCKSIHFHKNEILLHSNNFMFVGNNTLYNSFINFTTAFNLSTNYWHYTLKKKPLSFYFYNKTLFNKSALSSTATQLILPDITLKTTVFNIHKLNLLELPLFNTLNSQTPFTNLYDELNTDDLVYILNTFETQITFYWLIEIYKLNIYLTLLHN